MSHPEPPDRSQHSPPPTRQLTMEQALAEDRSRAVVVTEKLRRWLELRPGLQLTLTTVRAASGELQVAASVSYPLDQSPPKMAGTWAAVVDVHGVCWPLDAAIRQAAQLFEKAERRGEAP